MKITEILSTKRDQASQLTAKRPRVVQMEDVDQPGSHGVTNWPLIKGTTSQAKDRGVLRPRTVGLVVLLMSRRFYCDMSAAESLGVMLTLMHQDSEIL